MRSLHPLLLIGLATSSVFAQSGAGVGKIEKDETVEYTSRSNIPGAMRGRISQHFSPAYNAGLAKALTFEFNSQDQNPATQESLTFEVRQQDPTTIMPDWPSMAPPLYSMLLNQGAALVMHWVITPVGGLSLPGRGSKPYYMVWDLPPNNLWTADGISVHMGVGLPVFPCSTPNNPACCGTAANPTLDGGERPRPPITENLSPSDTPAGPLSFADRDRSYYHWIVYDSPTLQGLSYDPSNPAVWFCPVNNPNGGFAAMHPDVNDAGSTMRNDDIGWRVRAGPTFQNGIALLYTTASVLPAALVTPFGDLWIDPFDRFFTILQFGPVVLNSIGSADFRLTLGPPASDARRAIAGFGNMHTQALVLNSTLTQIVLTNLSTKGFDMNGGLPFTVVAGTPFSFPVGAARNVQVQNDGNGDVLVEFLRASFPLGSMNVLERTRGATGGFTQMPPGTTDVRITTLNANPKPYPTSGTYRLL
jgi:hypothetical protein